MHGRRLLFLNLKELYEAGLSALEEACIDSPECDAFYLFEHVTGVTRGSYLLTKDRTVKDETAAAYMDLIRQRAEHMPYQYLTGYAPFLDFELKVNENVLIPRFDTEIVIDAAVKVIPQDGKVLDLCTGSGCVIISLKKLYPYAEFTASDVSPEALSVAKENASMVHGVQNNIEFVLSDLFESFEGRRFDVIVSNPPYVSESEYAQLAPEVKDHEPPLALLAGPEGLDIHKRLIEEAPAHLNTGGTDLKR